MKKELTYKKLEDELSHQKLLVILLSLVVIIFTIFFIVGAKNITNSQKDLQTCQEQVEIPKDVSSNCYRNVANISIDCKKDECDIKLTSPKIVDINCEVIE